MPPLEDLRGRVFGNLIVRCRGEDAIRPCGGHVPRWWCLCNCGNMMPILVEGGDLKRGQTVTCGCHKGLVAGHRNKTHGESTTHEYATWIGIHRRCYDPKERFYASYGGRGIKVCDRWHRFNHDGLCNFITDMGRRPNGKYTIERIDVDGDYCPQNCTWILNTKQCQNKRNSRVFVYKGVKMIQSAWAKTLGVYPSRIQYHLWAGRSFEETVDFLCRKYPESKKGVDAIVGGHA